MFGTAPDLDSASSYAKRGIEVDGVGTEKLWENYGTILMHQYKYVEAREAFTKALLLEPNSEFAKAKLRQIEKRLKNEKKSKKDKKLVNKENLDNSFELTTRKSSKNFLTKKASRKELVQFC